MQNAHAAGRESTAETELTGELVAFASLLHQGSPEAQDSCRTAVKWLPVGVLLEQLIADITIVYSPPKVGSSTIAATLNRHPAVRPEALHLHYLSQNGLSALESQIAECSHPNVRFLQEHLAQGHGARMLLTANRLMRNSVMSSVIRKPYVIVGVREPVALSISLAFEGWWTHAESPDSVSTKSLRRAMFTTSECRYCDDWFADELETVFGLDVFGQSFPTDRGWDIYENDSARVLLIRQENLGRLPSALGALYKLDPATFVVENCNLSADKDYANHYATIKRTLRLSDSELDWAYGSRYVQHFYSEQEIAGFRHRWSTEQAEEQPLSPETALATGPNPTCGSVAVSNPFDATPHISVCRPCWRCEQQLLSIPGLLRTCAEQQARIEQLEASQNAALHAHPLRGLARRIVPRPLRSLARRVLGSTRRGVDS